VGSQEDEISKLLSPSIYYGDCYAVGGDFVIDVCGFVSIEMTGQGILYVCLQKRRSIA
jgi:hypothetical protein